VRLKIKINTLSFYLNFLLALKNIGINKMKKLIALSLCSLLAACGGGGSESTPKVNDSVGDTSTGTVTNTDFVIGTVAPLSDARVCADVNQNSVCEESEFLGLTSTSGAFTVAGDYADTAIIIDAVPEQTLDINTGILVDGAYTMYAEAGTVNVSAVTTMSVDSGYSMQSIADMWLVDLNMVTGDYTTLLESGSPQAILVGLASDYAVKLLQEGGSLSGVPQSVSLVADYVYSTLESGVSPADISFELDSDGQMYVSVPSVDGGTGDSPFIQELSEPLLVGDWSAYYFDRVTEDDGFGRVTITEGIGDAYCSVKEYITANKPIPLDAEKECVDFLYTHNTAIAGDAQYRFAYGHKSDKGTALLFKAYKRVENDNFLPNGYMWIDNYDVKEDEGMGLRGRDWWHSIYSGFAKNSEGDYDHVVYKVDFEASLVAEYANGEVDEGRLTYVEDARMSPTITVKNQTLSYYSATAIHQIAAFRVDDYVGLGMFKRNQELSFGLFSPNGEIISSTLNAEVFDNLLINMIELEK